MKHQKILIIEDNYIEASNLKNSLVSLGFGNNVIIKTQMM